MGRDIQNRRIHVFFVCVILSCLALVYFKDDYGITFMANIPILTMTRNVSNTLTAKLQRDSNLNIVDRDKSDKSSPKRLDFSSLSRYIHFSVKDDNTTCDKRRYIVYTCSTWCGGWGDRLKGITSLFLLAQLTNRTLLIDMHTPCELGNFVTPNIYDWKSCLFFAQRPGQKNVIQLRYIDSLKLLNLNNFISGNLKNYQIIRIQTNQMAINIIKNHTLSNSTMPWLHTLSVAEVIGSIIGILFKPTVVMSKEVELFYYIKVKNKSLVCSHIRYGNNPSNPRDAVFADRDSRVSHVLAFLKKYDNNDSVIFVATDAKSVRNQSKNTFSNYISTDQAIVHIDQTQQGTDASCQGFKAAILDNILLSTCDVLVLTRSGFGTMAAYMRGTSDNIFIHLKERDGIFNVTLSGIQETYNFH